MPMTPAVLCDSEIRHVQASHNILDVLAQDIVPRSRSRARCLIPRALFPARGVSSKKVSPAHPALVSTRRE